MSKDDLEMPLGQEIYSPLLIDMHSFNSLKIKYDLLVVIDPSLGQNFNGYSPQINFLSS